MGRVVLVVLAVLLSTFEVRASTAYPVTIGGATTVARGQGCYEAQEAIALWSLATTVRNNNALGTADWMWAPTGCTFDATTGKAMSVTVAVNENGAVSYPGGAVVWGTADVWLDDAADPATFAAWFVFTFISTLTVYFIALGCGYILGLFGYRR